MVKKGYLATLTVKSDLYDQIKEAQKKNKGMARIQELMKEGKARWFSTDNEGVLFFGKRIVVPKDHNLRRIILDDAHSSQFSIHPGSTKMYQDLKQRFWWTRMKREIARYVAECDVCQMLRPNISNRPVLFNPYLSLHGSGKILEWTLSPGYQGLPKDMILYG